MLKPSETAFRMLTTEAAVVGEGTHFHPRSILGILICLIGSSVGVCVATATIYQHLLNYTTPRLQRAVIRILFITPVYSVLSLLSLVFIPFVVYFNALRDVWEAVVIYCFLSLILDYCGGESACSVVIEQHPGSLTAPKAVNWLLFPNTTKHVPVLLLRRIPLNPAFIKACKRATLQFVFLKPLLATVTVLLALTLGRSAVDSIWLQCPLLILYNVSCTVALYALVLFYAATRAHPGLEHAKPLRKFAAVKIIIFATYWQDTLIYLIGARRLNHVDIKAWSLFLFCLEMPLIALLQAWAFPVSEFTVSQTHVCVSSTSTRGAASAFKIGRDSAILKREETCTTLQSSESPPFGNSALALHPNQKPLFMQAAAVARAPSHGVVGIESNVEAKGERFKPPPPPPPPCDFKRFEDVSVTGAVIDAPESEWRSETTMVCANLGDRSPSIVSIKEDTTYIDVNFDSDTAYETNRRIIAIESLFPRRRSFVSQLSPCQQVIISEPNEILPPEVIVDGRSMSSTSLESVGHDEDLEDVSGSEAEEITGQSPPQSTQLPPQNSQSDRLTQHSARLSRLKNPLINLQRNIKAVRDPESRRLALQNARDVVNVKDIVTDTFHNFGRRYAKHSLLGVPEQNDDDMSGDDDVRVIELKDNSIPASEET